MRNQRDRRCWRLGLKLTIGEYVCGRSAAVAVVVGLLSATTLFSGCSGSQKNISQAPAALKDAYEAQRPYVVATSEDDKRPSWVKETVSEKDGQVRFSGGFLNGSDYAVSIRCANAEALKVAAQGISQFIRAEFSSYVQGSNTGSGGVDRYVSDGIATFVDNLHVQGVRQAEIYYEEVMSPAVMQPTYNVWVRLEMSKADFLLAKSAALQKLRDRFARAGEVAAKEKAEKLLLDLQRELREEAV